MRGEGCGLCYYALIIADRSSGLPCSSHSGVSIHRTIKLFLSALKSLKYAYRETRKRAFLRPAAMVVSYKTRPWLSAALDVLCHHDGVYPVLRKAGAEVSRLHSSCSGKWKRMKRKTGTENGKLKRKAESWNGKLKAETE